MSIKLIYCIYDLETKTHLQPFYVTAQAEAIRAAIAMRENDKSELHLFPDQFALKYIGNFHEDAGFLEEMPHEEMLVSDLKFAAKKPEINKVEAVNDLPEQALTKDELIDQMRITR